MDPVSAIGVTAAALTFLDVGRKALVLCREVYDSSDNATKANKELDEYSQHIGMLDDDLRAKVSTLTISERHLIGIANKCIQTSGDLAILLKDVRGVSSPSFRHKLKAAFRVLKHRREIERLEKELNDRQRLLDFAVIQDIRNKIDLVAFNLSKEFKKLDSVSQQLLLSLEKSDEAASQRHLETTARLQIVKDLGNDALRATANSNAQIMQGVRRFGDDVSGRFAKLKISSNHREVLSALSFPGQTSRRLAVKDPFPKTFEWVFDEKGTDRKWSNFPLWLQGDGQVYWISGKLGSGKSTLMAFILDDHRTRKHLLRWSGVRELHMLSYFFWRAGSELQKSVQVSCDHCYISCSTVRRLTNALHSALVAGSSRRFLILIDGLDEYEGDYPELLDALGNLRQVQSAKFCLASRLEAEMLRRFSSYPQLRMEVFNWGNIRTYVAGKLRPAGVDRFIVFTIVSGANGVFLWACIVAQSVLRGLAAGDDELTISQRLEETPRELEELFDQLLRGVEKMHRKSFASFLQLMRLSREGLCDAPSLALVTAAESGIETGVGSYQAFVDFCRRKRTHIIARSQGLLEISEPRERSDDLRRVCAIPQSVQESAPSRGFIPLPPTGRLRDADPCVKELLQSECRTVGWVHRSAYDYVMSKGIEQMLADDSAGTTDAEVLQALIRARISLLAMAPSRLVVGQGPFENRLMDSAERLIHAVDSVARISHLLGAQTESLLDELKAVAKQCRLEPDAFRQLTVGRTTDAQRHQANETSVDDYPLFSLEYDFYECCHIYVR
ncbi:hypothetical protein LTR85_006865 [Meristemomyces frigidus]|nr:hypothetical protein LTR85_006865 [Meristemomyces frigidus]